MQTKIIVILISILFSSCDFTKKLQSISPEGNIKVVLNTNEKGEASFLVLLNNEMVIENSPLGIVFNQEGLDFSKNLKFIRKSERKIDEKYSMVAGKTVSRSYRCTETVFSFKNAANESIDFIFRLFNDGVAFSYRIQNKKKVSVVQELSGYNFKTITNTWSIPYSSSEERSFEKRTIGAALEENSLSFPVLVETESKKWALMSESNVSDYPLCSGKFSGKQVNYVFSTKRIAENFVSEKFVSPWRVLILGEKLGTIVESCIIDHLAPATKITDFSWIEAGVTSFPWWGNNMANSFPDTLKKYIDLSAEMGWRFMEFDIPLIGSPGMAVENWKTTDWIKDVVDYGLSKGVLCNGWDDLKNLNTPEKRKEIFSKYNEFGVRGIKVDFVNSYTQSTRKLIEEVIQDAIQYKLMVSFHGAQSPRGFARTYPNVITFEAVKGSEYYLTINGGKGLTAQHNCSLPFTRNVLGSMDYTPVAFSSKIRETTAAHELALSIIFESGWQGICDTPEALLNSVAKPFLSQLNASWDELKFLDGYPGEYCCLARRKGTKWFVAGINAGEARTVNLNLSFLNSKSVLVYTDLSDDLNSLGVVESSIPENKTLKIEMRKNGGFAFVVNE
jgi:alpha-glucosidase